MNKLHTENRSFSSETGGGFNLSPDLATALVIELIPCDPDQLYRIVLVFKHAVEKSYNV